MPDMTLDEVLAVLEDAAARRRERKIDFFQPYAKQRQHIANGLLMRERLLMAGNQQGKTETGAYECAMHLTGQYPADWPGRKFVKPIRAWGICETSLLTRDVMQKKLCGPPGVVADRGTGFIPRAAFVDQSLARGVSDAYDTIQVEHRTNGKVDGISTLTFKSYEQGRSKMQGEPIDYFWCDEEPPEEVYSEVLTRTVATGGSGAITFTPLNGMSAVVIRFIQEENPDRAVTIMTIDDAEHIPAEKRASIIAAYPPHEREARARGVPMLGSGLIFQVSDASVMEPAIEHLPLYWPKLWGIDFGIGHPFAAVLTAWDRDNDVIHIVHVVRVADQRPLEHSVAMKPIGADVPVAWPRDGTNREAGSGQQLAAIYRQHDLRMLPSHATWPDGSVSTEAGIAEMDERMRTGRLKIASHLSEWFEEKRMYHRKDGQIVKIKDDLMSATRIAIMDKRNGRAVGLGGKRAKRKSDGMAKNVDFDVFGE